MMGRASSSVVRRLLESALVVAACAGCSAVLGIEGYPGASTVEPVDSGAASGKHEVPSAPAGCDTTLEPRDAPACVADGFGVFVDAARGSDQGPGTRASPLKTISAAIAKRDTATRVYVCEGSYPEAVRLDRAVSVYGGFACGTWRYASKATRIAPRDVATALTIVGVPDAVVIADLSLEAPAGMPGRVSSIAVVVRGARTSRSDAARSRQARRRLEPTGTLACPASRTGLHMAGARRRAHRAR